MQVPLKRYVVLLSEASYQQSEADEPGRLSHAHQDKAVPTLPFEQDFASVSAHGEQVFPVLSAHVPVGHSAAVTHWPAER